MSRKSWPKVRSKRLRVSGSERERERERATIFPGNPSVSDLSLDLDLSNLYLQLQIYLCCLLTCRHVSADSRWYLLALLLCSDRFD